MNKKVKATIAAIIVIFLGLGIYTFASPNDEPEELLDGNKQQVVRKTDGEEKEEETDLVQDEEDEDETTDQGLNGGNGNNNRNVNNNNRAPQNTQGQNQGEEEAKDETAPIVEVKYSTTGSSKEVKVEIVSNEPLKELDGWKLSEDKLTLTRVFDKNIDEELDIKDLNDNISPIVIKIDNVDKENPTITVKDTSKGSENIYSVIDLEFADNKGIAKVEINDKEVEVEDLVLNFKKELYVEGDNTVKVFDEAGNEATLTFELDTIAPTFDGKEGKIYTSDVLFNTTDKNLSKVTLNGNVYKRETIKTDGNYTIVAVDKAGNESTLHFKVDKTAPKVEVTYSNEKATKENVTVTIKSNEDLQEVKNWTKVDNKTYTKEFNTNETGTVEVKDIAGNKTKVNYAINNIDKENPTIEGIDNNAFSNKNVTLTITDNDEIDKVTVNKVKTDVNDGKVLLEKDGKYEVVVTDKAGNATSKTFTIDKTKATINIPDKSYNTSNVDLKITEENLDYVNIYLNHASKPTKYTTKEITLDKEGTYQIDIFDKAGNKVTYWAGIDLTKPVIEASSEETNDNITLKITDKYLLTVTINDKEYTRNNFKAGANNEDFTFETVLDQEGTYKIVAKDKTGYTVEKTVVIDRTAPKYTALVVVGGNGIWDNKVYNQYAKVDTQLYIYATFAEKLEVLPTVKLNDKDFGTMILTTSSEGSYKYYLGVKLTKDNIPGEGLLDIKVSGYADKFGNVGNELVMATDGTLESQKNVIIDRENPVITGIDKEFINGNVTLTITDANIKEVTVTGVEAQLKDNKISFTDNGTYIVNVTDKAGNETSKTFTIDKINPTINIPNDGYNSDKIDLKITEDNLDYANIYVNHSNKATYTINTTKTIELKEEGTYQIDIFDKAGNTVTYWSHIDNTKPVIEATSKLTKDDVTLTVKDRYLSKVIINNTEYTRENFTADGHNENFVFETVLDADGVYTVKAIDKVGNEVTETITIDKTKPVVNAVSMYVEADGMEEENYLATVGDKIIAYIKTSEKMQTPVFNLVDSEEIIAMATPVETEEDGVYTYTATYTITKEEMNTDGEIGILVTDLKDELGNEIDDVTAVTDNHKIVLDKTAPTATQVNMYSNGKASGLTYFTKEGKVITVYARFNEKLQTPKFEITAGEKTVELKEITETVANNIYTYTATYEVNGEELDDGALSIKLSNLKDLAGNKLDNITAPTIANKITIDTTKPEIKVSVSNYDKKKDKLLYTNQDITVTLKSENEDLTDVEGWEKVDSRTFTKTFGENTTDKVVVQDIAGNETEVNYKVENLDKTKPTLKNIEYSTTETTTGSVIVTITASKSLYTPDGWRKNGKDYVFTKEYTVNTTEDVVLKDLYGNTNTITVTVNNIKTVQPITFKITSDVDPEGKTYEAEDNMTWGEWIDSNYNTSLKDNTFNSLDDYLEHYWATTGMPHNIATPQRTTEEVRSLGITKVINFGAIWLVNNDPCYSGISMYNASGDMEFFEQYAEYGSNSCNHHEIVNSKTYTKQTKDKRIEDKAVYTIIYND